jgi:uncharacterized small protein (DUF1192 family)
MEELTERVARVEEEIQRVEAELDRRLHRLESIEDLMVQLLRHLKH